MDAWVTERNHRAAKVHWRFMVTTAETKLKRWYEQVNPANKGVTTRTNLEEYLLLKVLTLKCRLPDD
ncbi:hypothetical protein GCM10028819_42370 [Spirosoma humi]